MASLSDLFRAGKLGAWWKFWTWKVKNNIDRTFLHVQNRIYGRNSQPWMQFNFQTRKEKPDLPATYQFGFVILPGTTGGSNLASHNALGQLSYAGWKAWDATGKPFESTDDIKPAWDIAGSQEGALSGLKAFIDQGELDYVCFMDEGDYFDDAYLARLVLSMHGVEPQGIYCDEDHYQPPYGITGMPFLKPGLSEALLLSINYLRHAFFHKDMVKQLNDQAMTLEVLREKLAWELTSSKGAVLPVPGDLYHAAEPIIPDKTTLTGRMGSIKTSLEQKGLRQVSTEIAEYDQMHVTWATKGDQVSIIVPTHDHGAVLKRMLDSLRQNTTYPNYEIIIVDNHSREEEALRLYDELKKDVRIRILRRSDDFNYSRYNNAGASLARGQILLFLNNDMEITHPDWLDELVMWAERPDVGVVGARLMYPNGRIQHAGVVIGLVGSAGHVFIGEHPDILTPHGSPRWYRNMLAVTGACMAMRREVYDELGGFDEAYQLTFSDITFCLKAIERGYRVVYNPFACLVHHEGGTRGDHIPDADIIRMAGELEPWINKGDPFYSPRLSRMIATPTIKHGQEEDPIKRLQMIRELAEYSLAPKGRKA